MFTDSDLEVVDCGHELILLLSSTLMLGYANFSCRSQPTIPKLLTILIIELVLLSMAVFVGSLHSSNMQQGPCTGTVRNTGAEDAAMDCSTDPQIVKKMEDFMASLKGVTSKPDVSVMTALPQCDFYFLMQNIYPRY